MTWFGTMRPDASWPVSGARVGITAGKVLGKAHERNRIKRRIRELIRRHVRELPDGLDLILHPRRLVMTMDFLKLDAEILRIFRQAAAQTKNNRHIESSKLPPLPAGVTNPKQSSTLTPPLTNSPR